MTGNPLNPALKNIYKLGVESRDKDIRSVIRHHQLEKAFDSKNSIRILKTEKENKSEEDEIKDVKNEIKIMIQIVEDNDLKLFLKAYYDDNKKKGVDFLKKMLDGITNGDMSLL